jgi:predicted metal-dependent peptidase
MLEERKLQKAKISLMRSPKFALLSGILMVGKTTVSDTGATACTNGRDEIYSRSFIKDLSDKELAFVVAHEAAHKMYRHLSVWRKLYNENAQLANAACDYVVNLMLKDADPDGSVIEFPTYKRGPMKGKPMGLIDERFRGMNTKQVFDILKKEQEESDNGNSGGDAGGEGGFDEHDWDGAKDMSEEEQRELERDIDQAIRQGIVASKKAGASNGNLDRELKDLMEPKVNWREVLREFVKSTCRAKDTSSWRRPNRRLIATDVYMPSLIGEKVGHLVVGVDTSGSVGRDELAEFLSEVKGIAEEVMPDRVDLLYWDTRVAAHEEYDDQSVANIVSSTKPRGGGGTSPSCVTTFLKEKHIQPECVIMLTDGYVGSDWGNDWPSPVLWAIVGGNDAVAPIGKTIHIKE